MQTFICQSTFSSIFTSVVSFVKLLRLFPCVLFCLRGPRFRTKMSIQKWAGKLVTVFNTSILTSFVTAGMLCFLPTNSWHPVVNPLDYAHSSLILMHVSEGERTVICEEAAESQEGFYQLFSATSVSLICSSLPKRSAASSPRLHKGVIWGAASSIWSPLFHASGTMWWVSRWLAEDFKVKQCLGLFCSWHPAHQFSLTSQAFCEIWRPVLYSVCWGLLESPWQRPSLVYWDTAVF